MPADTPARADTDPLKNASPNEYMDWFKDSPDPFQAITALEYGSDRSLVWNVELAVMFSNPDQRADLEKKLLGALSKSTNRPAAIAFVCRMLSHIGGPASVPALEELLKNPETADSARVALQAIPGEEATLALMRGLDVLSGKELIGLIGSVAVRGDRRAVPALKKIESSGSQPKDVQEAAARGVAFLG